MGNELEKKQEIYLKILYLVFARLGVEKTSSIVLGVPNKEKVGRKIVKRKKDKSRVSRSDLFCAIGSFGQEIKILPGARKEESQA